jgi:hypothetical protein
MSHTTAMSNDTLSSHLLQAFLLYQPCDGVEGASYFECADALEVFALEEQVHFWLRGLLALPLCFLERIGRLRSGGEVCQGGVGEHWCVVDMGFDQRVGGFDRGARQGTFGGGGGHDWGL